MMWLWCAVTLCSQSTWQAHRSGDQDRKMTEKQHFCFYVKDSQHLVDTRSAPGTADTASGQWGQSDCSASPVGRRCLGRWVWRSQEGKQTFKEDGRTLTRTHLKGKSWMWWDKKTKRRPTLACSLHRAVAEPPACTPSPRSTPCSRPTRPDPPADWKCPKGREQGR